MPARGVSLERTVGYIGLFCSLLIIASIVGLAVREKERLYQAAAAEAQTASFFLADHASRLFEASDFLLSEGAGAISDMSWTEVAQSKELWEHIRALSNRLPYVDAVWLNDATGELRQSSVAYPSPQSNVADRDFFLAFRAANPGMFVSKVVQGRVTGKPTFLLTRRLNTPTGGFDGIVSVSADLGYFNDFYGSLKLPYTPLVRLFRAIDMSVLGSYPPAAGEKIAFAGPVASAIARQPLEGMIYGANSSLGAATIAYHQVRELPVYVGVVMLEAMLDRSWMQQLRLYGLFGGAALLALTALTLFAFRQARQVAQAKEALETRVEERTADLAAANAELGTLFQEVHHRVKNNLQVVTSLLRLQQTRVDAPVARAALQDSINRVQAMGLVHQLLYSTQELSQVEFAAYAGRLAQQLVGAYGMTERIGVAVVGDGSRFDLDTAIPLALIVNEVVSNALKHAFPDERPGSITIELKRDGEALVLSLTDDGIGMPDGMEWADTRSLGLRIIRSLSSQLDGTVSFSGQTGTRFTLRFPSDSA